MSAWLRRNFNWLTANIHSPLGLLFLLLAITGICGIWNDAHYFSWSIIIFCIIVIGLLWPILVVRFLVVSATVRTHNVHALEPVAIDIHIQNRGFLVAWGIKLLPHSALPDGMDFPPVWPWQTHQFTVTVRPAARGHFPVEPFSVTTRFPFDLLGKKITVQMETVLVWPQPVDMTHFKLNRFAHSTDAELTYRAAPQGAVLGLRNYRPGDHYRQISWRHVAKIERLVVRESEEPFGMCHRLVIDTKNADAFERSLRIAAGLIEILQDELTSICCGNDYVPPGTGESHVHKVLDMLAAVQISLHDQAHHHRHSLWIGPVAESPAEAFVRTPLEGIVLARMGTEQSGLAESA